MINELEVEKQRANAYSIWKEQERPPGAFKRGINSLRLDYVFVHDGRGFVEKHVLYVCECLLLETVCFTRMLIIASVMLLLCIV